MASPSPEPSEEVQRLRATLNLEQRPQQSSPSSRRANPFSPAANKRSISSASTPTRTFDEYIKYPDSVNATPEPEQPPPPAPQPTASTSKKRRRSQSQVRVLDYVEIPPLEPLSPKAKRRPKPSSSQSKGKASTAPRSSLARTAKAGPSNLARASGSPFDDSRLTTPVVDSGGSDVGPSMFDSPAVPRAPVVEPAPFRADCRPLRSWGAVPSDLLGRVSSFAAELPALSTADTTSMEWLYEIVGCDAESLTDEKDDWASATLSSAPSSPAMSSASARLSSLGLSNDGGFRPRRSSTATGSLPRRASVSGSSSSARQSLDSLLQLVNSNDAWMDGLQQTADKTMDDERASENERGTTDEAPSGSGFSQSGPTASDGGRDGGLKMRSPDSGEMREDETLSSEGDESHLPHSVTHVCSTSTLSGEAEKRIASLERQLAAERDRNDQLQQDVHSSSENHLQVVKAVNKLKVMLDNQEAVQRDADRDLGRVHCENDALRTEVVGLKKIKADLERERAFLTQTGKDHKTSILDLLFRLHTAQTALSDPNLPNATPLLPEPEFSDLRLDADQLSMKTKVERVNAHLRTYLFQLQAKNGALQARLDARVHDDEAREMEILESRLLEKLPLKREVRERKELEAARSELDRLRAENLQLKMDATEANELVAKQKAFIANYHRLSSEGASLFGSI